MKLRSVAAAQQCDPHAAPAFAKLTDFTDLAFERAFCYHYSIPDPKGGASSDAHANVPGQEAYEPAHHNTHTRPGKNTGDPIHTRVSEQQGDPQTDGQSSGQPPGQK
jgi:hypothetical protein